MARIKFKQINSSISYSPNDNILYVSGAVNIIQSSSLTPALAVSGAMFIVNSNNVASASFNTSGSINVDIMDVGTY